MDKAELHAYIASHHGNICEIAATKDGDILYEDCWQNFRPEDSVNTMSVTKSVTSLLIGIAKDQGLIQSVRQKILEFFPDYTAKRGERTIQEVTLEHLLTMTAPYKYKSEPWSKVCGSEDWTRAALDILGGRNGITGEFQYSTLGVHILTGLIAKTSGMTVTDFANRFLFEPLGIAPRRSIVLETAEIHKAFVLSKQPKKALWVADDQDVNTAGWGLCLSARDMVKIGQMCLNGGSYNGKQIVSADWLRESTTTHYQCDERFANMCYGYLWWIPDKWRSAYAAIGDGGNVIYVNPEKRIVVAVASTFKPRVFDRVPFIHNMIEPMLEESKLQRYDPSLIGYQWDDEPPRIQLEPGANGDISRCGRSNGEMSDA